MSINVKKPTLHRYRSAEAPELPTYESNHIPPAEPWRFSDTQSHPNASEQGPTDGTPPDQAAAALADWHPVLPVPLSCTIAGENNRLVLPGTTRMLECKPNLPLRRFLHHIRGQSTKSVILLSEAVFDSVKQLKEVDEFGGSDRPREPQYGVLAEVLDFEIFYGTPSSWPGTPLPDGDWDRWLSEGTAPSPTRSESDSEDNQQWEWLGPDVQAIRILVRGQCRVKFDPVQDMVIEPAKLTGSTPAYGRDPTSGAGSHTENTSSTPHGREAQEGFRAFSQVVAQCLADVSAPTPPAESTEQNVADVVFARARAIPNTLDDLDSGDDAAGLGTEPSTPADAAPSGADEVSGKSARLARLTELLVGHYNGLALRHPNWSERIKPCGGEAKGVADTATLLENMADQLLADSNAQRQQWLQIEGLSGRIEFLLNFIDGCKAEAVAAPATARPVESAADKLERRRQYMSPEWRALSEKEDSSEPTFERDPFERQKYLLELPQLCDRDNFEPPNLKEVRRELDRRFLGLAEAKEAVVSSLRLFAHTQAHHPERKGKFIKPLCLIGPPGVGKTSLVKAVAAATGRALAELHLPSIDGALDLTGSKMQWKAPTVGTVIKAMHRAGKCDAVMLLDEIDKLRRGAENHVVGDPTGVLQQLLDPLQVSSFTDQLITLPYDLTQVLFIATANDEGEIYPALKDRMRIVRLPGYSDSEKLLIARNHLIPALEQELYLQPGQVTVPDTTIQHIVSEFATDPGARGLSEKIEMIYSYAIEKLDELHSCQDPQPNLTVTPEVATTVLSNLGREAYWSTAWKDALSELPKGATRMRQYLTELPQACDRAPMPEFTIDEALVTLNKSHHGMDAVKQHILDYFGVMRRRDSYRITPMCLIGPRGVGKTTIARAIAEITNRPFQRISVGGMNGHPGLRGELFVPGRILQAMLAAQKCNPVILLDEIDKIPSGAAGNEGALLEILDSAQNAEFVDPFLGLAYSLEEVLFIATANDRAAIPAELQDRLEIIQLPDYTPDEKRVIAREHLIPSVLAEVGLNEQQLSITDDAVDAIMQLCASDVGVRSLGKCITRVAKRFGCPVEKNGTGPAIRVDATKVIELLGPPSSHSPII